MSIPTLTTLAVVRDAGQPTKGDIGKAAGTTDPTARTSNLDILAATLPTGLVAAYTTFIGAVTGIVDKDDPTPNDYETLRWIGFAVLILAAALLVRKKYKDAGGTKEPIAEMAVAAVTSAAFGLGMPEGPLAVRLGEDYTVAVPLLIAFIGVAITLLVTDKKLQQQRT